MEQANEKWSKQVWNETGKCEMEQLKVKWNKQMWNGTSKCREDWTQAVCILVGSLTNWVRYPVDNE